MEEDGIAVCLLYALFHRCNGTAHTQDFDLPRRRRRPGGVSAWAPATATATAPGMRTAFAVCIALDLFATATDRRSRILVLRAQHSPTVTASVTANHERHVAVTRRRLLTRSHLRLRGYECLQQQASNHKDFSEVPRPQVPFHLLPRGRASLQLSQHRAAPPRRRAHRPAPMSWSGRRHGRHATTA
jgi:hypothetical protein